MKGERSGGFRAFFEIYGSWLLLAVVAAFTAFQWHVTLVYAGLKAVELPSVNRMGWNSATINGLSRFLVLVLGIFWLSLVTLLEPQLREAHRLGRVRSKVVRLILYLGVLYGLSHLLLLLLA